MNLKKISDKKKYAFFIVFIFMIGNVYNLPNTTSIAIGDVCMIFFIIGIFIKNNKIFSKNFIDKNVLFFIVYSLLITFLNILIYNIDFVDAVLRIIRDSLYYFIIFFIGRRLFDINDFKKMVTVFCILLGTMVILQFFVYQLFGYYIPGFVLNANINSGGYVGKDLYNHYLYMANITGYLKPNGFLCEPASCAQCFFVGLILVLFYNSTKDKNSILIALYITIGAILTFSANAIIYCIFAWLIWFKELIGKRYVNKKQFTFAILIIVILGIAIALFKDTSISIVISRLQSATSSSTTDGSTQLRVYKGFQQFLELPFLNKIFGIGFGNYNGFYKIGIFLNENEYMNSIAYLLISSGILGFILYLNIFFYIWNRMKKVNKVAFGGLLIMMFASSVYSTVVYVWLVSIITYEIKDSEEVNKNVC